MLQQLILLLIVCISFAGSSVAYGQSVDVDALRLEILVKLVSQNQAIDFSSRDTLFIDILYSADSAAAANEAVLLQQALDASRIPVITNGNIIGRTRAMSEVTADGWSGTVAAIITVEDEAEVREILGMTAEGDVLSLCTSGDLTKNGVSIGVDVNERLEPEIWFNITSLNKEGAVYSQEILQFVSHQIW